MQFKVLSLLFKIKLITKFRTVTALPDPTTTTADQQTNEILDRRVEQHYYH